MKTKSIKMKQTTNAGGNPYLNGLQFKGELPVALRKLKKHFGPLEKVGRKNIYFVDNEEASFYVWIVSAPSNLKFDSAIKGIIKEYGNFPLYVYFTRDVNTYPDGMGDAYWSKIKKVYANAPRAFRGAIMGLNEMNAEFAEMMLDNQKIKLNFQRFIDITKGAGVTWEQLLKEIGGLSNQKVKLLVDIAKRLK